MKKFFGCLGAGCFTVIFLCAVAGYMAYNWCSTTGRSIVVDAIDNIGVEAAALSFTPETAAEIASISADLKKDFMDGKLSLAGAVKYCIVDNATESASLYSQMLMALLYRKLNGNITEGDASNLADAEGAEAVKTVLYGLQNGKVDAEKTTKMTAFLTNNKSRGSNTTSNDGININLLNDSVKIVEVGSSTTSNDSINKNSIKHGISKEDMQKAVDGFKALIKSQNLDAPESDFDVDISVKEALLKFIDGIRANSK